MVMKPIDTEKLKFIDLQQIPAPRKRSLWKPIFQQIPEGKALVISDKHYGSCKMALRRLQTKHNEFLDFVVIKRKPNVFIFRKSDWVKVHKK